MSHPNSGFSDLDADPAVSGGQEHQSAHDHLPALGPVLSRLSGRLSTYQNQPRLNDGFDNYPPPLPSDPVLLHRVLTDRPDVERQMGSDAPPDGGLEAWAVVFSTVFVLFCVHGLGESVTVTERK